MKEIRMGNFRCYEDQSIEFKPGINLLIGDNASGKTTILKACKYVLSAFFSGFSDENTRWISPDESDFTENIKDGIILPEKPVELDFTYDYDIYSKVPSKKQGLLFDTDTNISEEEKFTLQKVSKKNSRALVSGISGFRDYAKELYEEFISEETSQQVYALPLFACFTTEDIHTTRTTTKIEMGNFINYAQKNSFGYYECLDGNGFLPYWLKRLLVLQEGQKNLQEIEIVRQAIKDALGKDGCNIIGDMHIRPIQKKIYYILTDGREAESAQLSDGYKRLVNIVTDIAFRCALLNRGKYNIEACHETKGTVLIDEIDLHLHPTLQASVFKGLRNAFPKLQFIATTHAPMVMTGIENNEENVVYRLSYSTTDGYEVATAKTYGLDVSTITEAILNQSPRDEAVDNQLKQLFDLIDEEQTEKARFLFDELKSQFGDTLPDLARAEAMLNFTIEDDNEED